MTDAVNPAPTGLPRPFPEAAAGYEVLKALLDEDRIAELAQAASEFLQHYPDHAMASKLLGLACLILGDGETAKRVLERTDQLMPGNGEVLDHLGCACNMLGRHAEAAACFERSLAADPGRAETWVNVGKNRRDMGDREGAASAYRQAIAMHAGLTSAHNNLSVILCELGRPDEALASIDKALELEPEAPWVHVNRGNALKDLMRFPEAIAAYDRALLLQPSMHEAWNNLADALQLAGDSAQAMAAAERALALDPSDPAVLNTLGTLYAVQQRPAEAEAMMRRALAIEPENATFWLNLGNVLSEVGDKIDCYRKALALKPDFEQAQSHLVFHLNYAPEPSPDELLDQARRYGALLKARITPRQSWANERSPNRALRVGIVSADLCQHPVSYFLEATLMAARDKNFVWLAYSNVEKEDEVTALMRTRFDHWCDAGKLTDAALIERILADQIDLLLDLSGHTAGHRLPVFAAKPAPVQATWLGYVGTTGVDAIDYLIADPHVLPEGLDSHCVETPWRLPECYMSFTRPPFDLALTEPPLLKNGYPSFGCFNNLAKVNDRVLDLWARLLLAVPDARLLLRAKQLANEATRQRVLDRFTAAGVDPSRIETGGSLPSREAGMAEYARVDIALDPFPYTGATTSAEALWMGVPVLTLKGDRFIARVGESFNRNIGLADWIATDPDDYIARAARFCRDVEELKRQRQALRLRGAASPLGNPVWFANQLETALRGMWKRYCAA
jgi:protein O-GlcNAc transferase